MFANRIEITDMPDMVDHSHISSQKLFDNSWKVIRDNYYDSELNEQSWSRWKEHYHGKIKTDEDAKVAIDTILQVLMIHIPAICQSQNILSKTIP